MFLLYAVVIGLLIGFLVGGRPSGLARLEFHWAWLAFLGFAIQVVLFAEPVSERVGNVLGPIIYVASTALVLVVVLRNIRLAGLPIVALGAASNLAAIVANGGYMPASPSATEAVGDAAITTYSNSKVMADPALYPLTDILSLPTWLPFANIFSIGDVLIGVGVVVALVVPMWRARRGASRNIQLPSISE